MITYKLTKEYEGTKGVSILITHLGNAPNDLLDIIFEAEYQAFDYIIDEVKDDMGTVRCENNSYWSSTMYQDILDFIMKSKTMEKWNPKLVMGAPMPRQRKQFDPKIHF